MAVELPEKPEPRTITLNIPPELIAIAERSAAAKGVDTDDVLALMAGFWGGRVLGRMLRELVDEEAASN